jgi:hypothetical protein
MDTKWTDLRVAFGTACYSQMVPGRPAMGVTARGMEMRSRIIKRGSRALRSRPAIAAFAAAVVAVFFGGVAYASIPGPTGVINACYTTKSPHTLRVIDSTAKCPTGTTALNWNQTGPPGTNALHSASSGTTSYVAGTSEIISMQVPPGTYAVSAHLNLNYASPNYLSGRCASGRSHCFRIYDRVSPLQHVSRLHRDFTFAGNSGYDGGTLDCRLS